MTDYSKIDFSDLKAAFETDEVVTHSYVRDITLASGKVLALITLDNGRDHTRPSTLGPVTLLELNDRLDELKVRADAGEIQAVGVTGGKPYFLAAGADLSKVGEVPNRDVAKKMAQLGHFVLGKLGGELGVPSFTFINGLALGGGVEIALNSDYRTVDASAPALGLPEVFLGIIPGWGGAYLLPNLIGIENALKVIVENPLKNNRMLKAKEAFDLGMADAIFPPVNFLEDSLKWADGGVLSGKIQVKRPNVPGKLEKLAKWDVAIGIARKSLEGKLGTTPKSPYRALELLKAAKSGTKAEGFEREDEALADLVAGDQFVASIYAFNLVQKRAKRPAGAPDRELAQKVTKVGIIGAGLMASQFALLFVRRLQVPVVITDLDQSRVDKASTTSAPRSASSRRKAVSTPMRRTGCARSSRALRTKPTSPTATGSSRRSSRTSPSSSRSSPRSSRTCPRRRSSRRTRRRCQSSRSARSSRTPERVVGFHFFNPVAVMPLLEIVKLPPRTTRPSPPRSRSPRSSRSRPCSRPTPPASS